MSGRTYPPAYRRARQRVVQEATHCFHCGREISDLLHVGHPQKATADHLIPRSKGGPHTVENLVPCCSVCNSKRGARDNWQPSPRVDGADDW